MTEITHLDNQEAVRQLREAIEDKWPTPDVIDSYLFLVSEIGEVGDALLRAGYGSRGDYIRHHATRVRELEAELGQVLLMLCTLASALDIDLRIALAIEVDKVYERHGDGHE